MKDPQNESLRTKSAKPQCLASVGSWETGGYPKIVLLQIDYRGYAWIRTEHTVMGVYPMVRWATTTLDNLM